MIHVTTGWECIAVSEATANHLRLGNHNVWCRTVEGVVAFLVLHPLLIPAPEAKGWHSLDFALTSRMVR